jgi:hypothetical protein
MMPEFCSQYLLNEDLILMIYTQMYSMNIKLKNFLILLILFLVNIILECFGNLRGCPTPLNI